MNGQWKFVIALICIVILVSVFGALTWAENSDLYKQIKDQERLELQLGLKDIEIEKLKTTQPIVEEPVNIDSENITDKDLIEFLADYVSTQKGYIKTLQQIMDNNGITYPRFIYAELEE